MGNESDKAAGVKKKRGVKGQQVLPDMTDEMGYDAIDLLSPEHERFCWHYATYGNGRAAYQHAFPAANETTARTEASKLLKLPYISQRLDEIRLEIKERYADTAGAVVRYHDAVLRFDRNELLDAQGQVKDLSKLPMDIAALLDVDVQLVKTSTVAVLKVPERRAAAAELARIHGLYNDKLHLTDDVSRLTEEELREELRRLAVEVLSADDAEPVALPGVSA